MSVDEEFADIGYGLAPFYSWNTDADPARTAEGVEHLHELGMDGFFVHPRPGVRDAFLTPDWMENVHDARNEADARGMDLWLYDEDSFPSGFAGGRVLDAHPEYRARGVRFERAESWDELPHDVFENSMEADAFHGDAADEFARAFVLDGDEYRRIPLDGEHLEAPSEGDAYLLFWLAYAPDSDRFNGSSYVDTRDPETVGAFIDTVYGAYEEYFSGQFGDTIPGVFTDEPNGEHGLPEPALDWSVALPAAFEERKGYDVCEHLPALVADVGETRKIRFDFRDVCHRLFVESYTRQLSEWCGERDLYFTGHLMEHTWPDLAAGGAYMPHFAEMSLPGIDCLFRPGTGNSQVGHDWMVAELDSVARQYGRRAACELWGGMGWSATQTQYRWMADWLLVLGVDFLIPHLVHYGLDGLRKRDWPQSFGPHMAGTSDLEALFEHTATVAEFLDAGEQVVDTGVLHPATSVWPYWSPAEGGESETVGEGFKDLTGELNAAGVGFDLLDEDVLREVGEIRDGRLVVGEIEYETVVIPKEAENVRASTADLLGCFADAGGDLLVDDATTVELIDGQPVENRLDEHQAAERVVSDALTERLDYPARVESDAETYVRLVETDEEYRAFVLNRTGESVDATLRLDFDALDAEPEYVRVADPYQDVERVVDGQERVELSLAPHQSVTVTFETRTTEIRDGDDASIPNQSASSLVKSATEPKRVEPREISVELEAPNVAVLDFCDLCIDGETISEEYVLTQQERIYDAHDIDYGPDPFGNRRWWKLVREGAKCRRPPGFAATYRFELDEAVADAAPDGDIELVVEYPAVFDVWVNGESVDFEGWWLDRDFRRASIGDLVVSGANELTLAADRASIEHCLEATYLLGEFGVDVTDPAMLRLTAAPEPAVGDLVEQGYPFYTGYVTYRGTIEVPDWEACRLAVPDDCTVATAAIDGAAVGVVGAPFTDRDVSEFLSGEMAEMEVRAYVSLQNVLGPNHYSTTPKAEGLAHPGMFLPHRTDLFRREHQLEALGLREPFALERL